GVRGTREVKPYAIRGPQAVVSACPREYRASDRVSLLGQSGRCTPRVGAHADFFVTASRGGTPPAGTRPHTSSSAGRHVTRALDRNYWLGGGMQLSSLASELSRYQDNPQTKD